MEHAAYPEVLTALAEEGCHNKLNNKVLIEASHNSYLATFIKNLSNEFSLADDSKEARLLMSLLLEGADSTPRIKKASIESLKAMRAKFEVASGKKEGAALFEKHIQQLCVFEGEKVEEMKAEGKEFDDLKAKRYLDMLVEAKKPAGRPGGKDFRAFLKT